MDVSYKCVLEFSMPEERTRLEYAMNGERYHNAVIEISDMIKRRLRGSASSEMLELWDECRDIAKIAGVVIY